MTRIALIILFLQLASANCFGQSSYKGLTPGKSTRADVERVLGRPTSQLSERLFKYTKDGRQVYVQYSKNSPTAIRIQLVCSPPCERSQVISTEALPKVADTRRTGKKGALEEYFSYPNYIILTYEENSQTQVSQVGYFSRALFEGVTPELPKSSSPPVTNSASSATKSRVSDIPLLNADVVSLRFYEAGAEDIDFDQREYKNRFSKSATRGVYPELRLQFPDPGRRIDFSHEVVFHRDGAFYKRRKCETWLEAGWDSSQHTCGVGWAEPGKWPIASYLVELFIEGRKIAAASFEVY